MHEIKLFSHTAIRILFLSLKVQLILTLRAGYIARVMYAERTFQHYAFPIINETGYTGQSAAHSGYAPRRSALPCSKLLW